MGLDYHLTPMPSDKPRRWRKIDDRLPQIGHASKCWYCRVWKGENKEQSYRRCWQAWKKVEAQLNTLAAPPLHTVTLRQAVEYAPPAILDDKEKQHSLDQLEAVYQYNPKIREELDRQGLRPADLRHTGVLIETLPTPRYEGVDNPQQFAQQLAVRQVESKRETTVSQELEAQYKSKRAKADAGQRAVKTAERFKEQVNHFIKWIGAQFPINSITSQTLIDYHAILLGELARGRRTAGGAKDQLSHVLHFVRSAFNRESLRDLPRLMLTKNDQLAFVATGEAKRRDTANWHDDLPSLATIIKASPDRLRLWLYLMLNCGFQQTDVAELGINEVNWSAGTIEKYKRRKGRLRKNVPEVTYQLWPETLRLLKEHKATQKVLNRDKQPRVLLNTNGNPLLSDDTQTDNIEMSYSRVLDKLESTGKKGGGKKVKVKRKVKRKPLAALRKTSATLLEHSVSISKHARNFTSIVSYFLGQSPTNVAKLHYTPEDSELMTEATGWLGVQYRKAGILF
jgi:integrase